MNLERVNVIKFFRSTFTPSLENKELRGEDSSSFEAFDKRSSKCSEHTPPLNPKPKSGISTIIHFSNNSLKLNLL